MQKALFVSLTCLSAAVVAAAVTHARTIVDTTINAAPATDAALVTQLESNTDIEVLKRAGGWYDVRTVKGQTGWLVMTSIKFNRNPTGATVGTSWYTLFESGRSGVSGPTATLGVRGLNTGTIKDATPAPEAVSAIGAFAVEDAKASAFAHALGLKAVSVSYLGDDKDQPP